jgi:hypothetical protein
MNRLGITSKPFKFKRKECRHPMSDQPTENAVVTPEELQKQINELKAEREKLQAELETQKDFPVRKSETSEGERVINALLATPEHIFGRMLETAIRDYPAVIERLLEHADQHPEYFFGRGSKSALAQKLKRTDPEAYRRTKQIAIGRGLVAAEPLREPGLKKMEWR